MHILRLKLYNSNVKSSYNFWAEKYSWICFLSFVSLRHTRFTAKTSEYFLYIFKIYFKCLKPTYLEHSTLTSHRRIFHSALDRGSVAVLCVFVICCILSPFPRSSRFPRPFSIRQPCCTVRSCCCTHGVQVCAALLLVCVAVAARLSNVLALFFIAT